MADNLIYFRYNENNDSRTFLRNDPEVYGMQGSLIVKHRCRNCHEALPIHSIRKVLHCRYCGTPNIREE